MLKEEKNPNTEGQNENITDDASDNATFTDEKLSAEQDLNRGTAGEQNTENDTDSDTSGLDGTTTSMIAEKNQMIKELEDKNKELNDKYLRLFSEFDNFRKRSIKEKIELTKTASAEMTEAILPVLDDLERANRSLSENPDIATVSEGLGLIFSKLRTTLKQKGLEEIPSIGEEFDTDFHEAITHIPATEESQKGKVVDEVQKGYILNGKVIRFSKVVVAN